MADEAQTKPALETLLERINAVATELREFRTEAGKFQGEMNKFRSELDIRLDRIESVSYSTRGEFVEMRAEFREFLKQFKQPA